MLQVHEEFYRGTLDEAAAEFTERKPRGEITLVIEGYDGPPGGGSRGDWSAAAAEGGRGKKTANSGVDLEREIGAMLGDGVSPSEASKRAAAELGARKKEAYAIALRLAGK